LVNTGVEDSLKYAMMYTPSWNVVSQKGLLHLKSYKEYVPLAIPQLMWFGKKHTALSEQEKKLVGK